MRPLSSPSRGSWAQLLTAAALLCLSAQSQAQAPAQPETPKDAETPKGAETPEGAEIPEIRDPTGGPAEVPPNTTWKYPKDDRAEAVPPPPVKTGRDEWEPGSYRAAPTEVEVDPGLLGETDGAYGRFDGDLVYGLNLGARFGESGAGVLQGSLHDFSSIGLVGSLTQDLSGRAAERFSVSVELDLRPLFLPRWALDLEQGPAWLDLLIDSLGIGFGGYWGSPRGGEFGDTRGVLGSLSIGAPLMGQAEGLWVRARGVRRFSHGESSLLLVLGWDFLDVAPWL